MLPPKGGLEHPAPKAGLEPRQGYRRAVPKLILSYPDGVPGAALLLLRLSCVLTIFPSLSRAWPAMASGWPGGIISAILTVALVAGIGARGAALLLASAFAADLLDARGEEALLLASAMGSAGALVLLGPGAYSIDAHRFGRRVIRLEPRSPERGDGG